MRKPLYWLYLIRANFGNVSDLYVILYAGIVYSNELISTVSKWYIIYKRSYRLYKKEKIQRITIIMRSYTIIKWRPNNYKLLSFVVYAKARGSAKGNGTVRIAVGASIHDTSSNIVKAANNALQRVFDPVREVPIIES